MKIVFHTNKQALPILLSIVLLPGCEWGSSKKVAPKVEVESSAVQEMPKEGKVLTGEVLVTINGVPVVTKDMLDEEREKLFKANPQFKAMLSFMPAEQLDRNIAEGLMSQEVINYYIHDAGIDKEAEYKAELEDGIKKIEHMINAKYFTQSFPVSVSDTDISKFYEENKGVMQDIIISRGGVRAVGLLFGNEKDAQDFVAQLTNDLQTTARQLGLADKVKDFKLVNEQSFEVDPVIRERLVRITTVPAVEIISTGDKNVWVVEAQAKEEPKYRPLDDRMKLGLRQYLEKEKKAEAFEKELEKLKSKYNVVFNDTYFGSQSDEQMGSEPEMSLEDFEALSEEASEAGSFV